VPSVIAATTPIEEYTLKGLEKKGLYIALNWINGFFEPRLMDAVGRLITDKKVRRNISRLGRSFIDGNGCGRVIESMLGKV
jgi:spore coat polysaccharide biosynthesis predicted glycosyltransferase SpsG